MGAFGVAGWEFFSRCMLPYGAQDMGPFEKISLGQIKKGWRLSKPDVMPEPVYDLFLRCWHFEPKQRPTIRNIVTALNDFINRPRCFDIVIDVKRTIPEHAKLNTKTTCIFMENKMSKIDAENYQKEKDRLSEPFEGASIIKRTSGWEQNHTIIEIHETEVH